MQNKANFQKSQVDVNLYNTTDYEEISNWTLGENKPNSNPIKANFRNAQMNVNSLITKDCRKKDDFAVQKNKPNSNPISQRVKLMQSVYLQRIMKKNAAKGYEKTKPNQSKFSNRKTEDRRRKTEDRRQSTALPATAKAFAETSRIWFPRSGVPSQ